MEPTSTIVSIIFLASFTLVLAPTSVDDSRLYALLALRASAIIACFLRGVLVPRIWLNPHYLVAEFGVLVTSTTIFMAKYAPSPDLVFIPFPIFWVIVALICFLVLERLFFLAVQSSGINLGYFGLLHRALWILLGNLGVGVIALSNGVAAVGSSVAAVGGSVAAAAAVFQAGEELEGVELEDVEADAGEQVELKEADAGKQVESETSPPPPYSVRVTPSISFTAHQDPTTQYIMPLKDVTFRNSEKIV